MTTRPLAAAFCLLLAIGVAPAAAQAPDAGILRDDPPAGAASAPRPPVTDASAPPDAPRAGTPEEAPRPAAAATPPAAVNYLVPDLGSNALVYDGKHFWFRPIFAWVLDYTSLTQDDASVTQVGAQGRYSPELRAGRLGFTLRSKDRLKWDLYVTADYQERRTRENATFELYDLQLRVPIGPVKVTIGKMKEPFSYELVGLSIQLPQQERILNPFFPTREIGVNLSGQLAGGRMTWAAGVFNDWLETGVDIADNATEVAGRVTALPWESPDKTKYVHVGVGLKHRGPDSGMMRFSGRPESNVTGKYEDTKDFPANGANQVAFEALWAHGPFSVLAEQIGAWVDSPERGDPHFTGYYVLGSWVLTGESRPYVRSLGSAGGVRPARRLGAVELVAKYSHVDLRDGGIDGGVLSKWHYGVNWWASAQWKLGLSYGDADLDRSGLRGNTKLWLYRLQWMW